MENKKTEIAEFYKKVFSDFKLKERLEERVKKITNEEDFKKLIREEIIPLMKRFKLNFSEEDLLNYEKETLKEISNEDLENVSGGALVKSALLAGGILSMALLGGVSLSANAAPPPVAQNRKASATQSQKYIPFRRWFVNAGTQLNHILDFLKNTGIKTTTRDIKTFLRNLKNNDLESFTKLESDTKYVRVQIQGEAPLLVLKGSWNTYNISADILDKIVRLNKCFDSISSDNTEVGNNALNEQGNGECTDNDTNEFFEQENDTDIKQSMSASEELEENEYEYADNNENNLPNNIDQNVNNDVNDSNDKTNRYEIIQKNNSDNEPITPTVKKELEENTKEYSSEDNNDDDYKIKGSKKDSSKKFVDGDNSKVSDTEKAKLKKAFIKELLKHNYSLESLYNRDDGGLFNYGAIAEEINAVIGTLKENNSVADVNWAQTNYDQENNCIKLFLGDNSTDESVDITLDEIRIFNLEKIRRAHARNLERHLTGRWEAFKGQRFAGILSYEHSMLDPKTDMTYDNGSLVQKLKVKTPFGESELWVYYQQEDDFLVEKDRRIRRQNKKDGTMYDMPYEGAMKSFKSLKPFDQKSTIEAIKNYLDTNVTQYDVNNLKNGETPLGVFNKRVNKIRFNFSADCMQDMSDFAAILMFCENSHNRVNAGGTWERALLTAAKEVGLDVAFPGYWLHVKTGTEQPQARWFSKMAVENFTLKDLDQIQTRIIDPVNGHNINAYKKAYDLNMLNFSGSSNEEVELLDESLGNEELMVTGSSDTEEADHFVNFRVKIGTLTSPKEYTLFKKLKCINKEDAKNRIETKYKYLKPTVLNIDGEAIPAQPSDAVSTTASDAEETDKK